MPIYYNILAMFPAYENRLCANVSAKPPYQNKIVQLFKCEDVTNIHTTNLYDINVIS